MKKSYHISKEDLKKILSDYFLKNGEIVSKCDFHVTEHGGDWNQWKHYEFDEVVVYVEEEKHGAKSKECSAGGKTCSGSCKSSSQGTGLAPASE